MSALKNSLKFSRNICDGAILHKKASVAVFSYDYTKFSELLLCSTQNNK